MSRENVKTVERAIAAINARDIDAYLACCTENVELLIAASVGADYLGADGIRRYFTDIEEVGPDFRIEVQRVQAIGDSHAHALLRVSWAGRASGIVTAAETANVYDFIDGKIRRVRIFFDRDEALKAVGLEESQEQNIALAERATEAFLKRDMDAFVACFHPSVEFMLPRNRLEGGSYRGLDGIRRALADVYETWEDIRFQRRESRATGDYVVVLGRTTNVGKGTAPTVGYDSAYVLKIEQGSIIRWQPYTSSAEGLKAVGLTE